MKPGPTRSERDRDRDIARTLYGAALMSDTKWRKLFRALASPGSGVRQGVFVFVGNDIEHRLRLPHERLLSAKYILESEVGPLPYTAIRWLELRRRVVPGGYEKIPGGWLAQDVDEAQRLLEKIGRFPIEPTADGIRIVGYAAQKP